MALRVQVEEETRIVVKRLRSVLRQRREVILLLAWVSGLNLHNLSRLWGRCPLQVLSDFASGVRHLDWHVWRQVLAIYELISS